MDPFDDHYYDDIYDEFDDGGPYTVKKHRKKSRSGYVPVKTSNTSKFSEHSVRSYVIMGAETKRTWCPDVEGAVEHATNLMNAGNADEFLVLKVVGIVKRNGITFEEI